MSGHLKPIAAVVGALALTASLAGCGSSAASNSTNAKEVTIYSADGLKSEDGSGFYDKVFKDFTAQTGIKVNYVEGGSGEMVQRLVREKYNTQADVIVTLPPFIQQADDKGLLQKYQPAGADKVDAADKASDGTWTAIVNNYLCFIYNTQQLKSPPKTWNDLLDPKYQGKFQYSTPGVAGDGTAVLIKAMHDFGGLKGATDFLAKLQKNNVGPSSSTGQLAPKVDKGELLAANGDVQMNFADMASMPHQGIFFPVDSTGKPTTFALPYAAGLVKNAPHSANAEKLLDFLLTDKVQQEASSIAGGFPTRSDVTPMDANAPKLKQLLSGVEVFTPDWADINTNLEKYVDAWKQATGS